MSNTENRKHGSKRDFSTEMDYAKIVERLILALQPLPEQLAITHKTQENTQHDRNQTVDESHTEKN